MQTIQKNQPNASFLVEVRDESGNHLCYYRVNQVLAQHNRSDHWKKMADAVLRQANSADRRLGIRCEMFHYCRVEHMDQFIAEHGIEIE